MIVHKTFTEQTTSLTGRAALNNREKLRRKAEEFITNEINVLAAFAFSLLFLVGKPLMSGAVVWALVAGLGLLLTVVGLVIAVAAKRRQR